MRGGGDQAQRITFSQVPKKRPRTAQVREGGKFTSKTEFNAWTRSRLEKHEKKVQKRKEERKKRACEGARREALRIERVSRSYRLRSHAFHKQ